MSSSVSLQKYAPLVLRAGLAFVFVWFGVHQLMDQAMWASLIPEWVVSVTGIAAKTFVIINGVFELIMAILLAIGFKVRIVASLLFLHMIAIIGDLGLTAVGIGLMFALLSVAFSGPDTYSFDQKQ